MKRFIYACGCVWVCLSTVAEAARNFASESSNKKLENGNESVADELINREIKAAAERISSGVGVSRAKSMKKVRSLLKSKRQLEAPKVSTLGVGSFSGFYISGGIGLNRSGQSMNCGGGGKQILDFEHKLPIGSSLIVRLRGRHGGGGSIGPDDVIDTIAEIPRMVTSADGNVQRVQLVRGDGTPVDRDDFYKIAGAAGGSSSLATVHNNNLVIKTELEIEAESISVDEKKRNTAGVVALGFGHVFGDRVYVGLEGMCDFQKDFVSEKRDMTIKTSGLRPVSTLRLGFLYKEWLFYTKIGASYTKTRIMNHSFGRFAPLIGGGVERRFGNLSFRMDADYSRGGSSYTFERSDCYSITYMKGYEGAAGAGTVGLIDDATYTKTLKRQVTVRRRGNFNVRLMLSYYVNN